MRIKFITRPKGLGTDLIDSKQVVNIFQILCQNSFIGLVGMLQREELIGCETV